MHQLNAYVYADTLEAIDLLRGDRSRSAYVRKTIESAVDAELSNDKNAENDKKIMRVGWNHERSGRM